MVLAARHSHTGRVAKWREYEEEAADLFRSLGLEANTKVRLEGVRASHDVDVAVRSRRAGLEQLWVVECKWRKRNVDKSHVGVLAEIVLDLGADRGVLLSEKGFQAGAIKWAYKSNVTLTSLAELREGAADELLTLRLGECRLRLAHVRERLGAVGQVKKGDGRAFHISFREAPGHWSHLKLFAALGIAEEGLRRAEMGRWPAAYAWDFTADKPRRARDLAAFIDGLTGVLDDLDAGVAAFEAANA